MRELALYVNKGEKRYRWPNLLFHPYNTNLSQTTRGACVYKTNAYAEIYKRPCFSPGIVSSIGIFRLLIVIYALSS